MRPYLSALTLWIALMGSAAPVCAQNVLFFSFDGSFEETLAELQNIEYLDILYLKKNIKINAIYGNIYINYYYREGELYFTKISKNYGKLFHFIKEFETLADFCIMTGGELLHFSRDATSIRVVTHSQGRIFRLFAIKNNGSIELTLSCTWVNRAPLSALKDFDFVALGDLEHKDVYREEEKLPALKRKKK